MHAEQDPYWAVVTWDKFKGLHDDAARLEEFFETGRQHVESVMKIAGQLLPGFAPRTVLDFGCGVGRLLVPFAATGCAVSGVDISEKMLSLTRENLALRGFKPVDLATSIPGLPAGAVYDLVHSFIVIQHIPVRDGVRAFGELLDRVAPGGVAALHVTYAVKAFWNETSVGSLWNHGKSLILGSKLLTGLAEKLRGKRIVPPLPMGNYPLNELFAGLHDRRFNSLVIRPSLHGVRGLVIFATREPDPAIVF